MTYQQLLEQGTHRLEEALVTDARLDARYLLEELTGLSLPRFLLEREKEIPDEQLLRDYDRMIRRREGGEPLQYIIGKADFMGHTFLVSPAVLIPRQDTETLCEQAIRLLDERPGPVRILDLCTGSGCILISILLACPQAAGTGADISQAALETARENARLLCPDRADFIQSDLFENIAGTYEMIVSNPPYIPAGDIQGLMREVAGYEPHLALDGGEDGLRFYRMIARQAGNCLARDGQLLLEIGYDQAAAVSELLYAQGWRDISVVRDLAGHDRVVYARCPD